MTSERRICRWSDLADSDARAFRIGVEPWPLKGFVVRQGERVFAYLNRCPHAGHPLNWHEDDFWAPDLPLLMCHSHGALFQPATGVCVLGPCDGKSLQRIDVRIEDDHIVLVDDPDELAVRFA